MEKYQTSLKERNVMIKLENINKYYQEKIGVRPFIDLVN